MADPKNNVGSNLETSRKLKLAEAMTILKAAGFDVRQRNEVAGYTLLALLDLKPAQTWNEASNPLRGITPIIEFIAEEYGVKYAPNTRETVRDEAVKYFVEAGLLVRNPDNLSRPTNSMKTVYQVESKALAVIQCFGTSQWEARLGEYIAVRGRIRRELSRARDFTRIPVTLGSGKKVTLSPGGQNPLIKLLIEEFCPRFVPGGTVIYIGDTEKKFLHLDVKYLENLRVALLAPAKMPDVVVHDARRNWLVLMEAVTSAGPVDGKRRKELKELFAGCSAGLIFVTAFENRRSMRGFLTQIAWESEVWVADDPDHLIHFNGERFLGPYPDVEPSS